MKMRRLCYWKILFLLIIGFIIIVIFSYHTNSVINIKLHTVAYRNNHNSTIRVMGSVRSIEGQQNSARRIVLSFVVCDARFNESLNVVKSVLMFTKSPVYFVIFADDKLHPRFVKKLSEWKTLMKNQFDFELQKIEFPKAHEQDWINLFSKCAAQRLFIPKLIPHIDAMIYVDIDTLFLGPIEELWQHFSKFNSSQISAMTLEDDNPNMSWYPRFAKHPFYGKYGLNSGVMLMNLTRMREFAWVDYVTPIMLEWKLYIPWGDQDIINIIFHYKQEAVYVLSCRYNYRTDQCMYGDACAAASAHGVHLLHGSRRAFHNHKQPAFEAIYRAIDDYKLGIDPPTSILDNLNKYISEAPSSNCGNLKNAFLKPRVAGSSRDNGKHVEHECYHSGHG